MRTMLLALGVGVALACAGDTARGQSAFATYGHSYRTIATPPVGAGSFTVGGAALGDGRLVLVTGRTVFVETAPRSGSFSRVADIDAAPLGSGGTTDPGFVAVSPDGSTIAVGAGMGRPVVVFATGALGSAGAPSVINAANARFYNVRHFDGRFADNTHLALTAGDFGSPARVTLLDVTSSATTPTNPTVIANIQGASSGVAFDGAGRLYTGNGWALGGGSPTGAIRAFSMADWTAAAAGGAPIDFESGGTAVARALSAGPLAMDGFGNLFIGGGDFGTGDVGYFGVASSVAVATALGGGGAVNTSDVSCFLRLDPSGTGSAFYGGFFNSATGELIITDGTTWYATIPGPGAVVPVVAAGWFAGRRRRV